MMFSHIWRRNVLSGAAELVIIAMLCAGTAWAQSVIAQDKTVGASDSQAARSEVSTSNALAESASGQTIPLASFSFVAGRDGATYTDTIVGTNPFSDQSTTTINVVLVPLIVKIGATIFDPTANDNCIAGATTSPLAAVQQSPVFQNVTFDGGTGDGHGAIMDGAGVGTTTYLDAFRRAEFWGVVQGTNYHTLFQVTTAPAWTVKFTDVGGGRIVNAPCGQFGVLPSKGLRSYIQKTIIPGTPAITPTTFAIFLMQNVVTTSNPSLTCGECSIGFHTAFGSPVQTYAVAEYDTNGYFSQVKDVSILAHEIAEWLDDPLYNNVTPAWGHIGEFPVSCQTVWENGDPALYTLFPGIRMPNGITYNPQELVFWDWFYSARGKNLYGAGGSFSNHGSFSVPALGCTTTTLSSSPNPSGAGQSVAFTATVSGSPRAPNGTVNFFNGGNTMGTATLSGGLATLNKVFPSAQTRAITATYVGNTNFTPSTSPTLSQVVNDTTTTTLDLSPNPSTIGQSVTFTATVTPQFGGTPAGTVTFTQNGTTILGTAPLNAGQAIFSKPFPSTGTRSITAAYSGSANFLPSTSPALTQMVVQATTTAIASSQNPSRVGQPVTLTATVTPQTSGTPTGTVTFTQNGNLLSTVPLSGGQASLGQTFPSAGTEPITAAYSGDPNFAASKSPAINQVVNQATTTSALASTTNPSVVGQSVTFTATVTPQFGGTPTGTVTFTKNGTTLLGTVPLTGGQASFSKAVLAAGNESITAAYSGDANFSASTAPAISQVVNQAPTTTALASALNPSTVGQSVTFTATVTPQFGGTATGTVSFLQNGTTLGTVPLNGGQASLNQLFSSAGTGSISVTYAGDANFTASTSTPLSQVVNNAGTTTKLASSPNPSTAGQSVTLTATVTPQFGGTPTGMVTFTQNGTTVLGTASLSGGQASLNKVFPAAGALSITVAYSGDANFKTSASSPVSQVVNSASTTTNLVSSPNPSTAGQSVTLTATVIPQFGGTPTGTITFMNGTATLGTVTLNGGQANFSKTFPFAGSKPLTAIYSGDASFTTSSGVLTQTVN